MAHLSASQNLGPCVLSSKTKTVKLGAILKANGVGFSGHVLLWIFGKVGDW